MTSKSKDLPFTPSEGFAFIVKYETTSAPDSFPKGGGPFRLLTIEGDTQFASLNSDQITIQPGTYIVTGVGELYSSGVANISLRVAAGAVVVQGASNIPDLNLGLSFPIEGVLTVGAETVYELYGQISLSNTMGRQSSFGVNEVYAAVAFIRI